jgi:methyl-accepting chemotaxis protein
MIFIIWIGSFSWITFQSFDKSHRSSLETASEYILLVDEARQAQVSFKKQVQEWKDILLRGNDNEAFSKYYSQFNQEYDNVQIQLKQLKEDMANQNMDTSLVDNLICDHNQLFNKYKEALKSYDKNNIESYHIVDNNVKGIDRKTTDNMDSLVKQIQEKADSESEIMLEQANVDTNTFSRNLIIIIAIGIIVTILFTILISHTYKGITRFIEQFKKLMKQAEGGDLTICGEIYKNDELGELTEHFNKFIKGIRNLIFEAKKTSTTVAASSEDIMKASDVVSKTAEEVAANIESVAENHFKQSELTEKSSNDVNSVVTGLNRITENTGHISGLASKAMETVNDGINSLKNQSERMINTKSTSKNVTNVIFLLSEKSKEIGSVIKFINGITEQINLLALNAAIEAASAGEAGRGFTVVANEVKKLAELSKESTKKINDLIQEVQFDIDKAVSEVNNTNVSIDQQAASLELTDEAFNLIKKSVFEVTNKIEEVATETKAINQNAISVEESIKNIVNIMDKNASNTEEVASATNEYVASIQKVAASINYLSQMSNNLQESVDKFKV